MLAIPHTLVGATLGSQIGDVPGQALIAFGVGWASHYVLDSLPHWDRIYRHTDKIKVHDTLGKWPRYALYQAVIDVVSAFLIIGVVLFFKEQMLSYYISPIFWGAVGGLTPDLLDNVPFWSYYLHRFKFFQKLYDFHHHSHISEDQEKRFPDWLGLVSQLILIAASLWLLLSR